VCSSDLCELAPAPGGAVEWHDPEGPGRLSRALDPGTLGEYRRELERRLQEWDRFAARHGFHHGTFSTELAFEEIVTQLLERK
jgi:hypothetical protein